MENKTELMQLRHPDYDRELTELVRSNLSPKAFREKLLDYHENDIAAALEALTLSERQRIYHALDAAELSAVLEYAEPMTAYLNELSLRRRVNVLSRMDADAAVDYLKTLESGEKNARRAHGRAEAPRDRAALGLRRGRDRQHYDDELHRHPRGAERQGRNAPARRAGRRARQHLHDLCCGFRQRFLRRDRSQRPHHRARGRSARRADRDLLSLRLRARAH